MPQGIINLLDIVKLNGAGNRDWVVEDAKIAPEVGLLPVDQNVEGHQITIPVVTALSGSEGFRKFNQGVKARKSTYELKQFQSYEISDHVDIDKALLARKMNPGAYLAQEVRQVLTSQFRLIGTQTYYGTLTADGGNASGFFGLVEQCPTASTHTIDATGTTANQKTSVWMIRAGYNSVSYLSVKGLSLPQGFKDETLEDSNGDPYQGLRGWIEGDVGLYVANKNSVLRIKNITSQTGKTLTDILLQSAVVQFQKNTAGLMPTHILMNSTTQYNYWQARITTEIKNPEWPTAFRGIPIITTESIISGEAN
jgi:hypothetical protein